MSAESYLSQKLSRFSLMDYLLVMSVYLVVGLLIVALYPILLQLAWWFDLLFIILCGFPLVVHLFSQPGASMRYKMISCLRKNTPALQVLLFLSLFFLALMISSFFPILASGQWWWYLLIIIILALKPLRTSWIW